MPDPTPSFSGASRRDFIKSSATLSAAMLLGSVPANAHAGGSDAIRVGLIGCGGRGTGAAFNCVEAAPGVKITALGDLFEDRIRAKRRQFEQLGDAFDVPDERCFSGFDAYRRVIECDVDLVILATPPGFRPLHLAAAVAAGKHVFAEKPIAVDPAGVRSVLESTRVAREKGLSFVAGTQRRHQRSYLETLKRIHDGALGEIVGGQCYWNQGGLWAHKREPEYSDMEWQIRNWLYFTWTSGDHIVEQHVHNLDVMNWAMGGHPVSAYAMGGRQSRTDPIYGHIYDHFAVEYEYPNGVRVQSQCRQIEGTTSRVGERLVGTNGAANPGGRIDGPQPYRHDGRRDPDAYVQEHRDLIAAIRGGEPLNEGRQIAESTLTAIMGRMSAYTGKVVTWDFVLQSALDLSPKSWQFGDLPTPAVALPGKTQLV